MILYDMISVLEYNVRLTDGSENEMAPVRNLIGISYPTLESLRSASFLISILLQVWNYS